MTGKNVVFPIYNSDGTAFHDLVLYKASVESIVMSLGDKITGDVYYKDNTLMVSMSEYILLDGVKYSLVNPPIVVREGMVADNSELKGMAKYSFTFYHPMYMLGNFPFTDVAVNNSELKFKSQDSKFSWIGNLNDFVAKINKNLQGTEWVCEIGDTVQNVDRLKLSQVLTFDKQKISDVLKTGYEEWEIPFIIDKIAISDSRYSQGKRFLVRYGLPSQEILQSTNPDVPYVFRFGQGVGLKNNSRNPKNNKIVTRLAGYGSETNIPWGYPQIVWTGDQSWDYTINNDASNPLSYPIYDGIVNGQRTRLIKHPFTRAHLMPSVYSDTVNRKVNPNAVDYNPDTEIKDYYDADDGTYENPINQSEPSYEIHEFEDIKPELGESFLVGVYPYDEYTGNAITLEEITEILNAYYSESRIKEEKDNIKTINDIIATATSRSDSGEIDEYYYSWSIESNTDYAFLTYNSSSLNFKYTILRSAQVPQAEWNDDIDDDGNYVQGYFKVKLPILSFDIYACAAATEEMSISMRNGACIGCEFKIQVDWDDYKRNMYDSDGNFAPSGRQRDYSKYPDSSEVQVTLIVQKDTNTFGTLMPNIYQKPVAGDKYVILGISLPQTYISNAESRLDDTMVQYLHENNVYYYEYPLKFDEYFLAMHIEILSQIKTNTIVRFEYGGSVHALYVKQITVKYGESPLPKYDITLTDDVEIILNQIGQVADDVSKIRMIMGAGSGVDLSLLDSRYLSKTNDDTANGLLRFIRGLQVGERFVTGLLGEGGVLRVDSDGTTYIEVDKMYVRMKAYFDTVEIRRYMHSNGNRVASLAGAKLSRVEYIKSNGNVTDDASLAVKFRCYFRVGEDGNTATNDFVVGDLVYCHITNESLGQGVEQHHYWRAVVGRNSEDSLTSKGEAYIDLSASDCQSGSDIPIAQDDIMQLGNKTDTTRQGAIIEFVGGDDAPSYQIYQGINSYSLVGKNYVRFGYDSSSGGAQAYIGNPDGSTYLWYHNVTEGGVTFPRLEIKANVKFTSPTTGQVTTIEDFANAVENSIEDLQSQIDGEIDTWFYDGTPTLSNLPASGWTTTDEKERHLGDLYYDIGTGQTGGFAYRFIKTESEETTVYSWQYIDDTAITEALARSAQAYDLADHKRRVFLTTPTPPYDSGDMWVNAVYPASGAQQGSVYNNDILRCNTSKAQGEQFSIGDWELASKYTDDSALTNFLENEYAQDLQNLSTQIDKKSETWYQDTDPSSAWTTDALKLEHVGDIWCDTSANGGKNTYIFRDRGVGQTNRFYWAAQAVPDEVFDKIDGKAAIYVSKPSTYDKNDMWIIESGATGLPTGCVAGDIVIADNMPSGTTKRTSYVSSDWRKKDRYTDDSAFNGYINQILNGTGASGDAATVANSIKNIKNALNEGTVVDGGLVLTSLIAMRASNVVWSGISGQYNASSLGGGIAYWAGGAMKDYDTLTDTQKNNGWSVERWAKTLHRFDGSGYIANNNIRWDANGVINISNINQLSALSISINNQLVATQPWVQNNFISVAYFDRLFRAYNGSTLINANDTTTTIDNIKAMFGFWTEAYISALGNGGTIGSSIYLSQLADVALSNPTNGQALVYDSTTQKWVNGTVSGGGGTVTSINVGSTSYSPVNGVVSLPAYPSDTKNTAGTTNNVDTKMFLVGATSQAANPQTYSNVNVYIGTDNCLYSNGTKVLTAHQSLSNYVTLNGAQTISAKKTFSVQQAFSVAQGTSPFTVTSGTLVSNLNADMLDGLHADDLCRKYSYSLGFGKTVKITFTNCYQAIVTGRGTNGTSCDLILVGTGYTTATNHWRALYKGSQVSWCTQSSARGIEIKNTHTEGNLHIRVITLYGTAEFDEISDLTGTAVTATMALTTSNVASATSLANSRTLWGQNFDGTANVSGNMTGVGSIAASDNITISRTTTTTSKFVATNSNGTIELQTTTNRGVYDRTLDAWLIGSDGTNTRLMVGNVGIGTTSPTNKLDVAGTLGVTGNLSLGANIVMNNNSYFYMKNTSGTSIDCFRLSSSDNIIVGYGLRTTTDSGMYIYGGKAGINFRTNGNTTRAIIDSSGNVGIGTTSPSYKLHVSGVIYASTGLFSDGYVSALGQNTSSDINRKDVIENNVMPTIEAIANAPAIRYTWKDRKDLGVQVGSIAQYWRGIIPEAVHTSKDGSLTMQYDVLALLVGISTARKVVDHEKRIAELERENKELKLKLNIE